jgi:hypothetical protein
MSKPRRITELQLTTNPSISDLIALARVGSNSRTTIGSLLNAEIPSTFGATTINGDLNVNGNLNVSTIVSASVLYDSGSTIFGNSLDDTHDFIGDVTISGSLFVSGGTELGGDIFPQTPQGATLGTPEKPFREIYLQSGSINIESDTPGDPSAVISNNDGNLDISVGGMRLIQSDASFIAPTGSFSYLSSSFNHIGSAFRVGDTVTTGSLKVSGSTIQIGNNNLIGITSLTGSVNISGSTTQIGNNTLTGNTNLIGSFNVDGDSVFSGSINIASGSSYYRAGNKLFNYGQWGSLETQSGSANTARAMKLDLQYNGVSGLYIAPGDSGHMTRIYVENTGLYNIQFSTQLHATTNTAIDFSIWFAKDGTDLANSNTDFSIEKVSGGGFAVAALNILEPISSGSYVELYWSATHNNGQLQYKPVQSNPTRPATPSIILTVTQIA